MQNWSWEEETERTMFLPQSFDNENVKGLLGVKKLWEGFDPCKEELEVEIIEKWETNTAKFAKFYFTSEISSDGPARIFAIYGEPKNKKNIPALLHIHGGGQTAFLPWVEYFTSLGYAMISIDWCGDWAGRTERAYYPETLKYCNQKFSGDKTYSDGTMKTNCWYHWTIACTRAITYLTTQPVIDKDKIGIFGISMGGTLCWNVAGIDKRVKACAPIYGIGFNEYRDVGKYNKKQKNKVLKEEEKLFINDMSPESYAKYIDIPVMILNASNDQHGIVDKNEDILNAIKPGTPSRLALTENTCHHIGYDSKENLRLWFDAFFKNGEVLPRTPKLSFECKNEVPLIVVEADKPEEVEFVKIFSALEINHYTRFYKEEESKKRGDKYIATVPVLNSGTPLIAYASAKYKNGWFVSSVTKMVIPKTIGARATAVKSDIIYKKEDGIKGFGGFLWPTDPVPEIWTNGPWLVADEKGVLLPAGKKVINNSFIDPRFKVENSKTHIKVEIFSNRKTTVKIAFGCHCTVSTKYSRFQHSKDFVLKKGVNSLVLTPKDFKLRSFIPTPMICFETQDENVYIQKIEKA